MKKSLFILILLAFTASGFAQFKAEVFVSKGNKLPYQVMYPKDYDASKKYPLVLFLHGAGERGNDNQKQLTHGKQFMIDNFQSSYPAIVIAPQCPEGNYWANVARFKMDDKTHFLFGTTEEPTTAMSSLVALVNKWLTSGKVDASRVYVGGLSMGGMGTFEIVWRMPEVFAAAFPICGGGDLNKASVYAKNTALWIFHGSVDGVVSVDNSRDAYEKLKALGCDVKYTEYEGVNHNSWDNVFQEKTLVPWLFEHRK